MVFNTNPVFFANSAFVANASFGKGVTVSYYKTIHQFEDVKVGDEVHAVLKVGAKVSAKVTELSGHGLYLDLSGYCLWVGRDEFVLAKRQYRRRPMIGQYGYMTTPHGRQYGQVRGNPRWTNEPLQFIYVHGGYGRMEEITTDHDFTPVDIPADPGA